mgnify:FL=1
MEGGRGDSNTTTITSDYKYSYSYLHESVIESESERASEESERRECRVRGCVVLDGWEAINAPRASDGGKTRGDAPALL